MYNHIILSYHSLAQNQDVSLPLGDDGCLEVPKIPEHQSIYVVWPSGVGNDMFTIEVVVSLSGVSHQSLMHYLPDYKNCFLYRFRSTTSSIIDYHWQRCLFQFLLLLSHRFLCGGCPWSYWWCVGWESNRHIPFSNWLFSIIKQFISSFLFSFNVTVSLSEHIIWWIYHLRQTFLYRVNRYISNSNYYLCGKYVTAICSKIT